MKRTLLLAALLGAAALLFPGCESTRHDDHFEVVTPDLDKRIVGKWELGTLSNPKAVGLALPERKITIEFSSERVNGFAGVNRFFGSYLLHGNAIKLGPLGTTMMSGPGIEYERLVLAALNRADRATIESTSLCFYRGEELLATFEPIADQNKN